MGSERAVELLMDLVRLPSVNPIDEVPGPGRSEEAVAQYLEHWLQERGFRTWRQIVSPSRYNVVGVWQGRYPGPRLMLAGHMDTVGVQGNPKLLVPRLEAGRVVGRGACDMKAAFACYMAAVEELMVEGFEPAGELYIAGVVDEEYRMTGAKHLGLAGPRVDWVVIGEPTDLNVQIVSRGRVVMRIITHGRSAHSSMPEQGVNAIYRMASVLSALEKHGAALLERPAHPLLGTPRLNVGIIRGGDQSNVVPNRCEIEVDRRTLPGETIAGVFAEMEDVLSAIKQKEPDLSVTLEPEPVWVLDALDTPADCPVVAVLLEEVQRAMGRPALPSGFPAGTDAPYFGAPAVLCGPGRLEEAHSPTESVAVSDLEKATTIYKGLIKRLLSVS